MAAIHADFTSHLKLKLDLVLRAMGVKRRTAAVRAGAEHADRVLWAVGKQYGAAIAAAHAELAYIELTSNIRKSAL